MGTETTSIKPLTAQDLDRLERRYREGFGMSLTEFLRLIETARAALKQEILDV